LDFLLRPSLAHDFRWAALLAPRGARRRAGEGSPPPERCLCLSARASCPRSWQAGCAVTARGACLATGLLTASLGVWESLVVLALGGLLPLYLPGVGRAASGSSRGRPRASRRRRALHVGDGLRNCRRRVPRLKLGFSRCSGCARVFPRWFPTKFEVSLPMPSSV